MQLLQYIILPWEWCVCVVLIMYKVRLKGKQEGSDLVTLNNNRAFFSARLLMG